MVGLATQLIKFAGQQAPVMAFLRALSRYSRHGLLGPAGGGCASTSTVWQGSSPADSGSGGPRSRGAGIRPPPLPAHALPPAPPAIFSPPRATACAGVRSATAP